MNETTAKIKWGRVDRSGPGVLARIDFFPEIHTSGRRTELICESKVIGYILPTSSSDLNVALYEDFPWEKVEILSEAAVTHNGIVLRPENSSSPGSTLLYGVASLFCQKCNRVTSFNVWKLCEASQVGKATPEYTYLVTCTAQRKDRAGKPLAQTCRYKPTSKLQVAVAVARASESRKKETT